MSKTDEKAGLPELDLAASKKEFIETFFKRGAEFTEELMRENEKLRYRVVQLEEERRILVARGDPTPGSEGRTLRELVARIESLESERAALKVDILAPQPDDRYVPSVDRMFQSCAAAMGGEVCAIVLTGMGGDGGRGVKAVKASGGRTVAEAPETAVIFGMPQEAIATGAVDDVVPLPNSPELIARFAQRK